MFIFKLLLLFISVYITKAGKYPTGKIYSTSCDLNYTIDSPGHEFFFKCTATFKSLYENATSCETYGTDSILAVGKLEYVIDPQVKCVSKHPLFVKVDYEDGAVELPSLLMEWRRNFIDFNKYNTYMYEVHFFAPKRRFIKAMSTLTRRTILKYTIYSKNVPEKPIHFIFFDSAVSNRTVRVNDVHEIKADKEIIDIPCIVEVSRKIVLQKISKSYSGHEAEDINSSSLSYHPAKGFRADSDILTKGQYLCSNSLDEGKSFTIIPQPDSTTSSTQLHHIITEPPNLRTPFFLTTKGNKSHTCIYDFQHSVYDLTCTSTVYNLTFEAEYINNTKQQMDDVIYLHTDKPESIYTSKIVIRNPTNESEIKLHCVHPSTRIIHHNWILRYDKLSSDTNKSNEMFFVHFDGALKCSASHDNERHDSLDFKQIECNNLFSCKELARDVIKDPVPARVKVGTQCWVNHEGKYLKNCKSLDPFKNGFFQCKMDNGNNQVKVYQDVYFFGFDRKFYIGNVNPPISAIMKMELLNTAEPILALPGNFTFFCETHSFYFERGIQWFFRFINGTQVLSPPENITDIDLFNTQYGDSSSLIRMSSFQIEDSLLHQVICAAPVSSILNDTTQYEWKYMSVTIASKNSKRPTIKNTKDCIEKHFDVGEVDQLLNCDADGFPEPLISWTFHGQKVSSPFKTTGNHNNLLQFPPYNESYAGDYICTATNTVGSAEQIYTVHTNKNSSYSAWSIVAIALCICIVLALPPIVIIIRRLLSQIKNQLSNEEYKEFMEGRSSHGSENENENASLSQPYDRNFEIPKNQFHIDMKNVLGKGAYGIVYKGTVMLKNCSANVAFKTVRPNCGTEKYKALLSELKIMISVGQHCNIISLIGAYTKEIKNGIVYIATELCSLGSLEDYLRNHKDDFKRDVEVEFPGTNQMIYVNASSKTFSVNLLFNWSTQIANGMEYLASKYVVHSDLATRNVLLDSNKIAKITDFGLSRKMYNYYDYVKKDTKKDPLPWKWMAIESLLTMKFSTHSDIWAYGVTIWEIFSLGSVPYPGINWTLEFLDMLENGLRSPKPKLMNSDIYKVLLKCWDINPKERPSFNNLKLYFISLLESQEGGQRTV